MRSPSPSGTSNTSFINRRRLKAAFPVLLGILLVPFLVSAFYGGDDHRDLLSRARRLYNGDYDEEQATLHEELNEADKSLVKDEAKPVHISNHLNGVLHQPPNHDDLLGYGSKGGDLSQDLMDYDSHGFDQDAVGHDDAVDSELLDYDKEDLDPELLDYDLQGNAQHDVMAPQGSSSEVIKQTSADADYSDEDDEVITTIPDRGDYRELFSLTSKDRRYISVFFEGTGITNPTVIPHPTNTDLWIVLAQRTTIPGRDHEAKQAFCTAGFLEGVLICDSKFSNLTIESSVQGACEGDLAYLNEQSVAQDVRLFYGIDAPYVLYGSQSQHTCIGTWLQDARTLLDPFHLQKPLARVFSKATELQRPSTYKAIEGDYFLFWDFEGKAYAHHEIWPKREFAQIDHDGSVGDDLAPAASKQDRVCMARFMPQIDASFESIQQGSNSLAITLCKRLDPMCKPSESNTFVMHIVHHRFEYESHGVLEPYVVLFQQKAPFALHAISQRPLWIHGREALTSETRSPQYLNAPDEIPEGHTERFAIPSISWKNHIQKYHGYVDDLLLLGIGIEDGRAGVMDITAGDLLQDLAIC